MHRVRRVLPRSVPRGIHRTGAAGDHLDMPALTWTCLRSQWPSQWPPCACMPLTAAAGAPSLYKL